MTLSLQVENYEAMYRLRCDPSIFVNTIRLADTLWTYWILRCQLLGTFLEIFSIEYAFDVLYDQSVSSYWIWSLFFCALSFWCTNSFCFYKWSSSSYSAEVMRSSILITDSLSLDIVFSSDDFVNAILYRLILQRYPSRLTLNIFYRTELQLELSLFFLLAPSTICSRLRHIVITALVVKDFRIKYIYYWYCSLSVTSWPELLSNGRWIPSSESDLCRFDLKTITIMTLENLFLLLNIFDQSIISSSNFYEYELIMICLEISF